MFQPENLKLFLKRDSSTGISLWICLCEFCEGYFAEQLLATTSDMMLTSFLQISDACSLKTVYLVEQ